ncbi:FAD-dependent oxidoreductase [Alkalimonas sp.]|uniref:FAD-dependent oxidoreductase n=1 Tax=Alkalimonas sp. TaxID=1872453 RepID=UPI002621F3FF|nr:FAD-dependent oxidoreductase [Alkalimonas sp.]MCC5825021.1 FAD-dependent oxidoreductase [Alkalimonas sp.]
MSVYQVWECQVCGWVYDEAKGAPAEGIAPGTRWQDIPDDWLCPECGVGKEDFEMVARTLAPAAGPIAEQAQTARQTQQTPPLVILGTGLAGYNLLKTLREQGYQSSILLITADDGSYYAKPQLSTGFARQKSAAELVQFSAEQMAEKYQADILIFSRVECIVPAEKYLQLSTGGRISYQSLVLACGAKPVQLSLAGNGLQGVHAINDLMDYARFRTLAAQKKRILVMGAGLIGSEYANDLAQAGFQVDLVDPLPGPLHSLVPEVASQRLAAAFGQAGINGHYNCTVQSIEQNPAGLQIQLSNGEQLAVDLVLSAVGVKPNTQLAQAAGLAVHQGIQVNRQLQSSEPDIYAIGDCAEVAGLVRVYVQPLLAQVKALANTLSGTPTEVSYGVMPVSIKTTLHPVVVNPPPAGATGRWQCDNDSDQGVCARFIGAEGQLLGYVLTGQHTSQAARFNQQCPALLPVSC